MTRLLEQAFAEASALPDEEQERFAAFVLEELAAEEKWRDSLERSQDLLSSLAAEALSQYRRGETKALNLDELSHDK